MENEATFAGLSLKSITVDDAGRVIVTDPELAERLRSSVEVMQRRWWGNTNNGCNNVKGCGDGQNINPGCITK